MVEFVIITVTKIMTVEPGSGENQSSFSYSSSFFFRQPSALTRAVPIKTPMNSREILRGCAF